MKHLQIFKGVLLPDGEDMSTLKKIAFPMIGQECYFQYSWVIEEDEIKRLAGQYACTLIFKGEYENDHHKWKGVGWFPESCLEVVYELNKEDRDILFDRR